MTSDLFLNISEANLEVKEVTMLSEWGTDQSVVWRWKIVDIGIEIEVDIDIDISVSILNYKSSFRLSPKNNWVGKNI